MAFVSQLFLMNRRCSLFQRRAVEELFVAYHILSDYGYVVLVALAHIATLQYMGAMVLRARRIYGVDYPDMYAIKGSRFQSFQ